MGREFVKGFKGRCRCIFQSAVIMSSRRTEREPQDSSVTEVTGYGLDGQRFGVRYLTGTRDFSHLHGM